MHDPGYEITAQAEILRIGNNAPSISSATCFAIVVVVVVEGAMVAVVGDW